MSKLVYSNNKKRMISGESKQESVSEGLRRWEDMNPDILKIIFDGVPFSDLSCNVSSVCHSWQLGCWLKFFWANNVLDLSFIRNAPGIIKSTTVNPFNYDDDDGAIKLMVLLKSILEDNDKYGICLKQWRLSIRTILIPEDFEIFDKHLLYIAERTTGLERLDLLGSSRITSGGFAKAIRKWRNVNSITLGKAFKKQNFIQFMEEIRKNCSSLNILSLCLRDFHLTYNYANVIARSLAQIKLLRFEGVSIHRVGINRILTHTHRVEVIQLCDCLLMGDDMSDSFSSKRFTINFIFKGSDWYFQNTEDVAQCSWRDWMADFEMPFRGLYRPFRGLYGSFILNYDEKTGDCDWDWDLNSEDWQYGFNYYF